MKCNEGFELRLEKDEEFIYTYSCVILERTEAEAPSINNLGYIKHCNLVKEENEFSYLLPGFWEKYFSGSVQCANENEIPFTSFLFYKDDLGNIIPDIEGN